MKTLKIYILLCLFTATAFSQEAKNKKVLIKTEYGDMVIELYDDTPLHRDNFLKLTREGYFDNQLFHRVIGDFMIQGGDPNSINAYKGEMLGLGGPGYTIPAEILPNHYHKKGAIAAARKGDPVNPKKESSGSQFYIVQGRVFNKAQLDAYVQMKKHLPFTEEQTKDYTTIGGTPHLDNEYSVFGEIVEGFNVLDSIATVPVDAYNRPIKDIKYTIEVIE